MGILDMLTARGALIDQLAALKRQIDAEAAERTRAIEEAQREVDKLDEPRRRLERLKAEEYSAGLVADRQIAEFENQLRDALAWPRALKMLEIDLQRFRDVWAPAIDPFEEVNRASGIVRIRNMRDIERRAEALRVWSACAAELHSTLWKLDRDALNMRIKSIRSALAAFDRPDLLIGTGDPERDGAA